MYRHHRQPIRKSYRLFFSLT
ncbi:hypothetical protein YPPY46_1927, partial [Yersinia pestis PY-46]